MLICVTYPCLEELFIFHKLNNVKHRISTFYVAFLPLFCWQQHRFIILECCMMWHIAGLDLGIYTHRKKGKAEYQSPFSDHNSESFVHWIWPFNVSLIEPIYLIHGQTCLPPQEPKWTLLKFSIPNNTGLHKSYIYIYILNLRFWLRMS